jgi:DNA mismatch repair ATPase MutS
MFTPDGCQPVPQTGEDAMPVTLESLRGAKQIVGEKTLLAYRIGEHYTLFDRDAQIAARTLGLTLCRQQGELDRTSFPDAEVEERTADLIEAGYRVAVLQEVHP